MKRGLLLVGVLLLMLVGMPPAKATDDVGCQAYDAHHHFDGEY